LLLASQRLEEGRLRGLDSHLSYRIGLRTFSAAESRIVLGVPDAYELPSAPGSGYLKIDVAGMTRFKAAYVSGPAEAEPQPRSSPRRYQAMVVPYGPEYISPREVPVADAAPGEANPAEAGPASAAGPAAPQESLLDRVVRQLAGQGEAARRICRALRGREKDQGEGNTCTQNTARHHRSSE